MAQLCFRKPLDVPNVVPTFLCGVDEGIQIPILEFEGTAEISSTKSGSGIVIVIPRPR